jgi:hypothetical protein
MPRVQTPKTPNTRTTGNLEYPNKNVNIMIDIDEAAVIPFASRIRDEPIMIWKLHQLLSLNKKVPNLVKVSPVTRFGDIREFVLKSDVHFIQFDGKNYRFVDGDCILKYTPISNTEGMYVRCVSLYHRRVNP